MPLAAAKETDMDKIALHRMTFYGYHGVYAEERKLGQRFIVDAELHLDLTPAGRQDDLTLTVNYAEAFDVVRRIVEGEPFQLIEALAERIASELLANYASVQAVTVRVTKPHPPFAGDYEGVSVEINRRRAQP
jgi:dihydroneopterin aldolase